VVKGHPISLAMSPFDRAHTTSYSSLIETIVYRVPITRYSLRQVQNLYILLPLLRLTPPVEEFSWDDLRKIKHGDQRMAKVHSGEEILPKNPTS